MTSFSEVKGFYPGSLLPVPMKWSPVNSPYVRAVNAEGFTIDGFSSNRDGTLNWIVVDLERAEYNSGQTMSTTRVRYLQNIDSACAEITSINSLSISCDGKLIPSTTKTSDIVNFTRLYQLPTASQIAAGLDMNNFKVVKSGTTDIKTNEYSSFTVTGLKTNSTYAFFAGLTGKDGSTTLYSLKEDTLQGVITTLRRIVFDLSSWRIPPIRHLDLQSVHRVHVGCFPLCSWHLSNPFDSRHVVLVASNKALFTF